MGAWTAKLSYMLRILVLALLIPITIAIPAIGLAFLDGAPTLREMAAPSPQDVASARSLIHDIRAVTNDSHRLGTGLSETRVAIPVVEANAALRLGARVVPGFRGRTEVREGRVALAASLPVPLPFGGERWLNVTATAPPFEGEPRLESLSIGGIALPPGPVIWAGRVGANLLFGERTGDRILSAASAMHLEGEAMVFTLRLDEESRGIVMRRIFGTIRGGDMPTGEDIDVLYVQIRDAIEDGRLPDAGSLVPHLRFALDLARARAGESPSRDQMAEAYTTAIFALTKACGAWNFTVVVGGLAGGDREALGDWSRDCRSVTLRGRKDTRLHFTTAAALKAASNRGVAVSIGEFKELQDRIRGGTGFDFTDLAANNSGIRLSDRMMAVRGGAWDRLVARIAGEEDVIVAFEGIPGRLTDEEFTARYGTLDSAAYAAEFNAIEAKIDALGLHAD